MSPIKADRRSYFRRVLLRVHVHCSVVRQNGIHLIFPKLSTTNNGDNGEAASIVKRNSCLFQA